MCSPTSLLVGGMEEGCVYPEYWSVCSPSFCSHDKTGSFVSHLLRPLHSLKRKSHCVIRLIFICSLLFSDRVLLCSSLDYIELTDVGLPLPFECWKSYVLPELRLGLLNCVSIS